MEYGMSSKLGWLRYRENQDEVFLGHSVARTHNISEETARLIDEEVRRLVEEAEATARQVLQDNIDKLHALAKALLEYETLSGDEVRTVLDGGVIERPQPVTEAAPPKDRPKATTVPTAGGARPEPQPGS